MYNRKTKQKQNNTFILIQVHVRGTTFPDQCQESAVPEQV